MVGYAGTIGALSDWSVKCSGPMKFPLSPASDFPSTFDVLAGERVGVRGPV